MNMQFQFNSDNQTRCGAEDGERIEEMVRSKLDHVADRLTRVEVHVGDVNGPRGGDDIRCLVELRPEGMQPISASHEAASAQTAAVQATEKALSTYRRQVGRKTNRKGH